VKPLVYAHQLFCSCSTDADVHANATLHEAVKLASFMKIPAKMKTAGRKEKWKPPPSGWIKVIFYGASKGNPCTFRGSCILLDDKGQVMLSFSLSTVSIKNFKGGAATSFK
ncbi:hypothetical protein KI387_041913, partial [Taxus chinensis]